MAYRGVFDGAEKDLNAIIRGETPIQKGDTFVYFDSRRCEGFVALLFVGDKNKPFNYLGRGMLKTAEGFAIQGS